MAHQHSAKDRDAGHRHEDESATVMNERPRWPALACGAATAIGVAWAAAYVTAQGVEHNVGVAAWVAVAVVGASAVISAGKAVESPPRRVERSEDANDEE